MDTGGVAKTDALAAFDYYIQHYNQGWPCILVGHSQGSAMTKLILFEYLHAHPDVYERTIAAYPIGVSITTQELADLRENARNRLARFLAARPRYKREGLRYEN